MAAFRLTPSAEEHIGEIVEFIAADNEDAAVRVRNALYSAFDLLASRPGIGHARDDLTDRPLKFWGVYSYLVVYDLAPQRHRLRPGLLLVATERNGPRMTSA
jgi:plasmid stabilization system protein ParE